MTRALAGALPGTDVVATDLNPAMLEVARRRTASDRVTFEQANAQDLPYPQASFEVVLCQFGMMFFPDKVLACREGDGF